MTGAKYFRIDDLAEFERVIINQISDPRVKLIRATSSDPKDTARWRAKDGVRPYWDANVQAIQDGVTIERIFFYDDTRNPNGPSDDLRKILNEHRHAGVMVRVDGVAHLSRQKLVDFVVWDDRCVAYFERNNVGEPTSGICSVQEPQIKYWCEMFEQLKKASRTRIPRGAAGRT
jgi:hypothetical protein